MFASPVPLVLQIGDCRLEFRSPREFEFALAGRIAVPASKIAKMVSQSDDALMREAEAIRAVERRFDAAISGSLEDVTSIGPFLKETELSMISQDHDWRTIVMALNATDGPFEEYKQIALVKYVQYLASRQEVIRNLFAARQPRRRSRPRDDTHAASAAAVEEANFRETAIIDLNAFAEPPGKGVEFSRLPKGETIEIVADPGQRIELLVAKHRCVLVAGERVVFVDDTRRETTLRPGKNIVGRESSCDVVLIPSYRDVSRKHLIVETEPDGVVRLTDISSHGTSIHPDYLENTSS